MERFKKGMKKVQMFALFIYLPACWMLSHPERIVLKDVAANVGFGPIHPSYTEVYWYSITGLHGSSYWFALLIIAELLGLLTVFGMYCIERYDKK